MRILLFGIQFGYLQIIRLELDERSHVDMYENMEDNKGTPTKRTGANKDVSTENEVKNDTHTEIEQPNHTSATPDIPAEMPARDR